MSAPGVITRNGALDSEQLASFRSLLAACNRFDGIELPIYLGTDAIGGHATTAFFVSANSEPAGFAHLPNDPEPEACLMVHPDHRRRGLGLALVDAMRAELRRRGLSEGLLVADQASLSGRAFLKAIAAPYQTSEYRLELDRSEVNPTRSNVDGLTMRVAARADAGLLAHILASAFATDPEAARDLVERGFLETTRRFYIASVGNEPVGILRAGEIGGIGDITAFGVLPARQGRGYGRWMLLNAIELLMGQGMNRIGLEVATENANALGLYTSCGFQVVSEYGFYTMAA